MLKQPIKKWVLFWISLLFTLIFWIISYWAWVNLSTVSPTDTLTSTLWNNLVNKVNDIWNRTDGIYSNWENIGIGNSSPYTKLDIASSSNISLTNFLWSLFSVYIKPSIYSTSSSSSIALRANGSNPNMFSIWSFSQKPSTTDWRGLTTITYMADTIVNDQGFSINQFQPNNAQTYERVRIDWNGNVWIWTVSPSQKLHVNWTALATAWNTTSDIRKKENIKELENPLEKISKIRWVSFDWNETKKHDVWVIAQEIEKVLPEIVSTDDDGIKSVDYSKLTPLLIEAIKEQQKQIDELKQKLEWIK